MGRLSSGLSSRCFGVRDKLPPLGGVLDVNSFSLTCSGDSVHAHANDRASAGGHGYALFRQAVAHQPNEYESPRDDGDDHDLATGFQADN